MNRLHHLRLRGWILVVVAIAFIAGHFTLFHLLWPHLSHVTLPSAVIAGVVILIVAKHLGLLGALLRSLISFFSPAVLKL